MPESHKQTGSTGITGRRGFVTVTSLGILSLYGLWSGYGAAPGLGLGQDGPEQAGDQEGHRHGGDAGGHGGHGAAADADAFRAEAEAYIQRYTLPDGSFQPPSSVPASPQPMADMDMGTMSSGGHEGHASHSGMSISALMPGHGEGAPSPIDVYLLVQQWMFEPSLIRLSAGVPYRFRMLALDVSHGASFQLGFGSRIVRLRPNTPAELLVTFERPEDVLLYCTVYCGPGHDQMHGQVVVT